jgi:TctA family transporter
MNEIMILAVLLISMTMGVMVGLLPGLPAMVGLFILLPLFQMWPVEAILLFFSCFICVTQYFGSVSALLFKVPGESSSLPVLDISLKLKNFNSIVKVYRTTAMTSFIASLFGILMFTALFLIFKDHWTQLMSTKVIVLFLLSLLILLIIQEGKYIFNIFLLVAGLALSHFSEIPYLNNLCDYANWMCFLRSPSEATLVLLGIFCVPVLFYKTDTITPKIFKSQQDLSFKWRTIFPFWKKGLQHGLLGFLAGFTPGAGLTLASNLSNGLEKKKNPKKLLTIAAAAEASNNSAAISSTIPFLFIGLPITASEIVIDNFLSSKFYRLNLSTLNTTIDFLGYAIDFVTILILCMLIINCICFLLCSHFINFWSKIMLIDSRIYLQVVKILILLSILMVIVSSKIPIMSAIFTLLLFGTIGTWAMRKDHNIIGFTLMVMMGPFILNKFTMFYQLYF